MSLDRLEAALRHEQDIFAYPAREWTVPRGNANAPVLDVVIVGGGMAGIATAIGLARERITNVLVVDRNPAAREGPWATYARMPTLRTVKELHGPDAALLHLTFQAWFEAQFGEEAFRRLHLIDRGQWMDYLVWLRRVMQVPVRNDTLVDDIVPADGLLHVHTRGPQGEPTLAARRVVLAGGYEGHGGPRIPAFMDSLPRHFWAHSSDAIDFAALRGRRVGVLGAGASAFDNSATALDHGACEVVQFVRRPRLPQVNWMRYAEFAGFFRGFPDLDDARKARFTRRFFEMPTPPPQDTLERTLRHRNYVLRFAAGWSAVRADSDRVKVQTPAGEEAFDFLILGTGFELDLTRRPELQTLLPSVALWSDRVPSEPTFARFPYLGPGFNCLPKHAWAAAEVRQVYVLGPTALPSIGPICTGLNGMPYAIPLLAGAISRSFFVEDADRYHEELLRFAEPESDVDIALTRVRGADTKGD